MPLSIPIHEVTILKINIFPFWCIFETENDNDWQLKVRIDPSKLFESGQTKRLAESRFSIIIIFNTFKSTFKHFIFATIYKANRIVIVCSEVVFIVSTNHERLIAFCEYLEWQIIVCVQTFNTNDDNGKGIDPAIGC